MQPLRGLHGAALRARPLQGRAVSRCCPRAPRGCVAARDARSARPAARSAAAAASRPARRRGGLIGAPRGARRAQRGGCGAGASLARPRLARLRRGESRCASRGARQPPGDTTATQAPARPAGAVRPAPSASALRAALQGLAAVVWRGGGRVPPAAPRLRSARTWSRAVLAGLRPRSLPFRGGCAPGCAGLAMRLTPPRKGRNRQPLPKLTPPPARPSRGGSAGWPPACFSLSVVIYSLRGERPPN